MFFFSFMLTAGNSMFSVLSSETFSHWLYPLHVQEERSQIIRMLRERSPPDRLRCVQRFQGASYAFLCLCQYICYHTGPTCCLTGLNFFMVLRFVHEAESRTVVNIERRGLSADAWQGGCLSLEAGAAAIVFWLRPQSTDSWRPHPQVVLSSQEWSYVRPLDCCDGTISWLYAWWVLHHLFILRLQRLCDAALWC